MGHNVASSLTHSESSPPFGTALSLFADNVSYEALMMRLIFALCVIAGSGVACSSSTPTGSSSTSTLQPLAIIDQNGRLSAGYNLFVNTDQSKATWLTSVPDGLQAAYPAGQQFGFVAAVLAGGTSPGLRPGKDVSGYKTFSVQLRGAAGNEIVQVGIKDAADPDDGSEAKKTVVLTSSWQPYTFTLTDFSTADLKNLYLMFELVFNGGASETVFLRDLQYLP
jgi:hypothetical protein